MFDDAFCFSIPMRVRFRGITHREGMLLRRGEQWREWSPFLEYDDAEAARWLEAAFDDDDAPLYHSDIPINVTVPVVDAPTCARIVAESGCRTAKVKIAEPGHDLAFDLERLAAVRAALGDEGAIRVDANAAFSVDDAFHALSHMSHVGLQYAEQPCATTHELAELRRRLQDAGVDVPIAADESIRKSSDPLEVSRMEAADYAICKVQPLGGASRVRELARELNMPVIVSSALETSIGIWAGIRVAASLPGDRLACGLGTVALLTDDVTTPLLPENGVIRVGTSPRVDEAKLHALRPAPDREPWWHDRLARCTRLIEEDA